jgi:hypothetical protein
MTDDVLKISRAGRARIDDLDALGVELEEGHLRLAAGGLPVGGGLRFPTNGCVPTYQKGEMDHPSDDFTIRI